MNKIKLNDFILLLKGNRPSERITSYYNKTMGLIFVKESTQEVFSYRGL